MNDNWQIYKISSTKIEFICSFMNNRILVWSNIYQYLESFSKYPNINSLVTLMYITIVFFFCINFSWKMQFNYLTKTKIGSRKYFKIANDNKHCLFCNKKLQKNKLFIFNFNLCCNSSNQRSNSLMNIFHLLH